MLESIKKFAASAAQSLVDRYRKLPLQAPHVHMSGTSTRAIPRRKYVTATGFASDPWMKGYCPPPAKWSSLTQSLQDYTRTATPELLNSPWIIHHSPRHLSVSGADVSHQLLGVTALDHEIFSALLRQFTQLYMEENPDKPYMSYAHFMDLDFATLVLAGHDYTRLAHIQDQFVGSDIMYPLHACQLFYVPSVMSHGCVLYIWDMVTSTIHVLDPMSGPSGCTPSVKARHEAAVSILHDGLFTCLTEFFSGWPVDKANWCTKYQRVADTLISRKDSEVEGILRQEVEGSIDQGKHRQNSAVCIL